MSTKPRHVHPRDLHGLARLAIDAKLGITGIVETMHHNISRVPGPLGKSTQKPTKGITGLVYRSIRGVTRLVGGGVDLALANLASLVGDEPSSPAREAVLAALNGVLGDHLAESGNPRHPHAASPRRPGAGPEKAQPCQSDRQARAWAWRPPVGPGSP